MPKVTQLSDNRARVGTQLFLGQDTAQISTLQVGVEEKGGHLVGAGQ